MREVSVNPNSPSTMLSRSAYNAYLQTIDLRGGWKRVEKKMVYEKTRCT